MHVKQEIFSDDNFWTELVGSGSGGRVRW